MSHLEKSRLDWVILGLLGALVVTNLTFLILLPTGGPLIGLAFYLILLVLTLRARQRDYRSLIVGSLVGLVVHGVEAATMGRSGYPVLLALNLVLPAALALSAWAANQGRRQVAGSE